jgi:hypothetical protein
LSHQKKIISRSFLNSGTLIVKRRKPCIKWLSYSSWLREDPALTGSLSLIS